MLRALNRPGRARTEGREGVRVGLRLGGAAPVSGDRSHRLAAPHRDSRDKFGATVLHHVARRGVTWHSWIVEL